MNINIKEDKNILKVMQFFYQHVQLVYMLYYEEQVEISFPNILYYLDFMIILTFILLNLLLIFQKEDSKAIKSLLPPNSKDQSFDLFNNSFKSLL
ncbi:unnamed protein product [Paramecium pentaurelia]|uniref:Uncharacterized protein n=1 Tax=Paramecium pentaurelia TaxID=43138 RepID=A0A8S1X332_9CILI|nr:unnamed protein product [Paramecium pentaurelia]